MVLFGVGCYFKVLIFVMIIKKGYFILVDVWGFKFIYLIGDKFEVVILVLVNR